MSCLALCACATPAQKCMANARVRADALGAQADAVEATLKRGYALHRQHVPETGLTMCYRWGKGQFPCNRVGRKVIEQPVSVDMDVQRDTLVRLRQQQILALEYALSRRDICARR